jgi:arsenate reductase
MSEQVTIFHNPRCSKSRATLELIQEREPEVVEYLNNPPTAERLGEILDMLGMKPRELMRTGESLYKENNLNDDALSRDELIAAMVANPILIERPIVIANGTAAIGRPPSAVLDIL